LTSVTIMLARRNRQEQQGRNDRYSDEYSGRKPPCLAFRRDLRQLGPAGSQVYEHEYNEDTPHPEVQITPTVTIPTKHLQAPPAVAPWRQSKCQEQSSAGQQTKAQVKEKIENSSNRYLHTSRIRNSRPNSTPPLAIVSLRLTMEFSEAGMNVALDLATNQRAELVNGLIPDRIAHKIAFPTAIKQLGVVKHAELFGNITLLHPGDLHEFSHGQRALLEGLEQAQPRGFGQGGEQAGGLLDLGIGQAGRGLSGHIAIWLYDHIIE
jgi:hypothetical protein